MVITMAKLHMAHASTHGARMPPGPTKEKQSLTHISKHQWREIKIYTPNSTLYNLIWEGEKQQLAQTPLPKVITTYSTSN